MANSLKTQSCFAQTNSNKMEPEFLVPKVPVKKKALKMSQDVDPMSVQCSLVRRMSVKTMQKHYVVFKKSDSSLQLEPPTSKMEDWWLICSHCSQIHSRWMHNDKFKKVYLLMIVDCLLPGKMLRNGTTRRISPKRWLAWFVGEAAWFQMWQLSSNCYHRMRHFCKKNVMVASSRTFCILWQLKSWQLTWFHLFFLLMITNLIHYVTMSSFHYFW